MFFGRIIEARLDSGRLEYEVLDRDGSVPLPRVKGQLDDEWWRCYQPLTRRYG